MQRVQEIVHTYIHTHKARYCIMLSLHISCVINQISIDDMWLQFDTKKGTFTLHTYL